MALDCYAAKALPCSDKSGHSTQAMHVWHIAKTKFVTLLSAKVVNSLEMVAES